MSNSPPASSAGGAPDAEALAKSLAEIAQRSQNIANAYLNRLKEGKATAASDDVGVMPAFAELANKMWADPVKLAEAHSRMWQAQMNVWQDAVQKFFGQGAKASTPDKSDTRFKSELWQNNFLFGYIKQSYLVAAENIQSTVAGVEGLDAQTARKVRLFTRQFVDALAPTNSRSRTPRCSRPPWRAVARISSTG